MIVVLDLGGNVGGMETALNAIDNLLQERFIAFEQFLILCNILQNVAIKIPN